jgi:hypothetical protein
VFNVHCVALAYADAKALARAVDAALSPVAGGPVSPHAAIGVVLLDDEYDQVEQAGGAGDDRVATIIQNFIVWAA